MSSVVCDRCGNEIVIPEPPKPGDRIRAARISAGLSQSELARRLGRSQRVVSHAERFTLRHDTANRWLKLIEGVATPAPVES